MSDDAETNPAVIAGIIYDAGYRAGTKAAEVLVADAARYRWLRNGTYTDPMHNFTTLWRGKALDDAIDQTRVIVAAREGET